MKKYKLIKEYPNSPKLGSVYGLGEFIGDYGTDLPYSYTEFWEEVVEKDYEILTYKQNGGILLYDLQPNGKYKTRTGKSEYSSILFNYPNSIFSIKRLSDGEIFTIGDKIDGPSGSNEEIVKIDLDWIYYRSNSKKQLIYTYRLKDIKKVKTPLFTTEDGVAIYEGDTFYIVDNWIPIIYVNYVSINEYIHNLKFSTKEKAEEYILMNKPCLNVNDILSLNEKVSLDINSSSYIAGKNMLRWELEKLVKNKLKK